LMIGRASVGNPWIFHEIKSGKSVDEKFKKEIILTHFDEMIKHYKDQGISIFRKHLHEYSKGHKDASAFRDEVNRINDAKIMQEKIESFF
ncbi:tRNA-dihydrouridine synthase, partial [Campylobacter jejuni]